MNRVVLPAALVAALALTSCGGNNVFLSSLTSSLTTPLPSASAVPSVSSTSSLPSVPLTSAPLTSPTSSTSAPPSTPKSSVTPSASTALSRVGIRAGDLPAGWSAEAPSRQQINGDAAEQTELRACAGAPEDSPSTTDVAESSDYSSDPFDVWSVVTRYRTAGAAHIESLVSRSAFLGCFGALSKRGWISVAPLGTVLGKVTVRMSRRRAADPANLVATVSAEMPVNDHGDRFSLYDNVFYLSGRTVQVQVHVSAQGRQTPADVVRHAVRLVAARAASA